MPSRRFFRRSPLFPYGIVLISYFPHLFIIAIQFLFLFLRVFHRETQIVCTFLRFNTRHRQMMAEPLFYDLIVMCHKTSIIIYANVCFQESKRISFIGVLLLWNNAVTPMSRCPHKSYLESSGFIFIEESLTNEMKSEKRSEKEEWKRKRNSVCQR